MALYTTQTLTKSADPGKIPTYLSFYMGLHCLPIAYFSPCIAEPAYILFGKICRSRSALTKPADQDLHCFP